MTRRVVVFGTTGHIGRPLGRPDNESVAAR